MTRKHLMEVVPLRRYRESGYVGIVYAVGFEGSNAWRRVEGWEDWGFFSLESPNWQRALDGATRATARDLADIDRIKEALAPTWEFDA